MNASDFHYALNELGFIIEHTGGGCTAWEFQRADGHIVRVTQDLSHEIEPRLFFDMDTGEELCPIEVGTYSQEEISDTYETFTDFVQALLYVINQVKNEEK